MQQSYGRQKSLCNLITLRSLKVLISVFETQRISATLLDIDGSPTSANSLNSILTI